MPSCQKRAVYSHCVGYAFVMVGVANHKNFFWGYSNFGNERFSQFNFRGGIDVFQAAYVFKIAVYMVVPNCVQEVVALVSRKYALFDAAGT